MSAPVFGLVTDNADPEGLGRVKVGLYSLGKDVVTGWIHMVTPALGVFCLPEVGDQVLVAFLNDNPDMPVMIGGLWSNVQRPPVTGENAESEFNRNGKNNLRFIRSREGSRMILDDSKGKEKIQLVSAKDSSRIELSAEDKKILLKASVVRMSSSGKIIFNGKECIIKASKGIITQSKDIKLESKGKDINVKAGNAIGIKGNGINLN
jgi:uncharacterized protein involved in type VI secretion and phage assembly